MDTTLNGTILIIEDSLSEMELMSHYLRESGFLVLNATGAKQGLAVALEQKPNVILTDVVMPGMSGFELCRSLKKNPETQKIPIIICTSKNQEIDVDLYGVYHGYGLTVSDNTTIRAGSGAKAEVSAGEILNAKVSFGGSIFYKGTPEVIKDKKVAGGIIKQIN